MFGIMAVFEQVQPVIGPYVACPAVCRDHDLRAVDVARQITTLVHSYLPQAHVEHVGSTAVPGCAGKGIVDLMIPVHDGAMEKVKELLDRLGFQHQTGPDSFPEERPLRTGSWVHDGETFLLHIHVIPASSPEVDEMRFFRACLRADPELVRAYVARKLEIIASGVTNSVEYSRIKGEFLKAVFG
jgi:GrpB-like predicted nucleotidyltransferase (UPF0157 family)